MLQEAANRHLSRLLLIFSDLCECDADIAACLTFMRLAPPPGEALWTAENVRGLMPSAFATVTSTSLYAANPPSHAALAYCTAVHAIIKARKDAKP